MALIGNRLCEGYALFEEYRVERSPKSRQGRLRHRESAVGEGGLHLHVDGLDVDPEALVIAPRYVHGELSIAKLRAAISSVQRFRDENGHSAR